MAANHKMNISVQPTNNRLSSAERRAAQVRSLAGQQAKLKQEAAERRSQRTASNAPAARDEGPGRR